MTTVASAAPAASASSLPFGIFQAELLPAPSPLRAAITAAYRRDECEAVQWLLQQVQGQQPWKDATQQLAKKLVQQVREKRTEIGIEANDAWVDEALLRTSTVHAAVLWLMENPEPTVEAQARRQQIARGQV